MLANLSFFGCACVGIRDRLGIIAVNQGVEVGKVLVNHIYIWRYAILRERMARKLFLVDLSASDCVAFVTTERLVNLFTFRSSSTHSFSVLMFSVTSSATYSLIWNISRRVSSQFSRP